MPHLSTNMAMEAFVVEGYRTRILVLVVFRVLGEYHERNSVRVENFGLMSFTSMLNHIS